MNHFVPSLVWDISTINIFNYCADVSMHVWSWGEITYFCLCTTFLTRRRWLCRHVHAKNSTYTLFFSLRTYEVLWLRNGNTFLSLRVQLKFVEINDLHKPFLSKRKCLQLSQYWTWKEQVSYNHWVSQFNKTRVLKAKNIEWITNIWSECWRRKLKIK
jgi:hypothetical protein